MTLQKFITLAFEKQHGQDVIAVLSPFLLRKDTMKLNLRHVYQIADLAHIDAPELAHMICERRCRNCGCTDLDCSQCIEKTGEPCSWVEEDLCSACVEPKKKKR